jgi:hypothetical protein
MKKLFILGVAVPGEASETMAELFLWPSSIVLLRKLAIYFDYILYTLRTTDFYVLGLQKKEKTLSLLLTVIPSKSHSIAVYIVD